MTTRFVDDNSWLYDYADLFLVHCPRCERLAKVVLKDNTAEIPEKSGQRYALLVYGERRLICEHCGYVDEWSGTKLNFSVTEDWFFHRPLWMLTPCCGETLSAFNMRHLDFLEKFVGAKLRQQSRSSTHNLANTLPKWIQRRENRGEVLKCIAKLRAFMLEEGAK